MCQKMRHWAENNNQIRIWLNAASEISNKGSMPYYYDFAAYGIAVIKR